MMMKAAGRVLALAGQGRPAAARLPDTVAILSGLAVPVVLLDGQNRFRYANQAAEHFFGVSFAQLRQIGLGDLLPPDSPLFRLIEQVRDTTISITNHDLTLDSPRLYKRGITVHVSIVSEEPDSVLLTMLDGSAARSMGRQLEYRHAARSVTGMAAIMAHEVKNPLSGIRGAAQLLEATVAPHDRELCELIRDEVDRIRALVDRMEAFDDRPLERNAVNIHQVLGHVRRLANSGFAAPIQFTERYDPSLPPVFGNRDQLVQVILNLVKNAAESILQAGVRRGEIILATSYQHGVRIAVPGTTNRVELPLLVTVRDNGPGVPEDIRQHLFEPFISGKPSGSGLGLALVAKIVADHGGLIEMDSRPGRTEFRLSLPVINEDNVL
jgi:two-component system nitrogen regulation sensor histidine kinase GlnL